MGAWLAAAAACATAPARPAPPPEPPSKRVCLWLFWSKDPAIIKQAQEMMRQGQPFQLVAIGLVRSNPRLASTNADCTDTSKLEPQVTAALAELRLGQVSKPIPLNQGLALAMRTSDRFRREAKAYFDRRLYKQAIDSLRLDLELHPAAVGSWHLLALSLAATGQRQEAVKAFDRALEWSPDDPALLSDKATTLQSLGRGAEAVKLYREALARQPDNPVYLNNLAWALVQENQDLEQAERLAARAARQAPDQVSIWDTLGQVQQARGRHAQAVISFYTAARLNPKYPRIQERLNRSLLALRPDEVARLVPSLAAAMTPPPAPAAKAAPAPAAKPKPKAESSLLPPVRTGWNSAAAAAEPRPPLLSAPAPDKPAPAAPKPKPRPKPKTTP
ncbi:MAG: tetratricopeptide repeat protein, partial [Thermodesulfobacteriota bacterium]